MVHSTYRAVVNNKCMSPVVAEVTFIIHFLHCAYAKTSQPGRLLPKECNIALIALLFTGFHCVHSCTHLHRLLKCIYFIYIDLFVFLVFYLFTLICLSLSGVEERESLAKLYICSQLSPLYKDQIAVFVILLIFSLLQ